MSINIKASLPAYLQSDEETLLTLPQATRYLNTSRSTFIRMMLQGKINGEKFGHTWRFTVASLKESRRAMNTAALPRIEIAS